MKKKELTPEEEITQEERKALVAKRIKWLLVFINLLFATYLIVQIIKVVYREITQDSRSCNYTSKVNNQMDYYRDNYTEISEYILYGNNLNLFYYDYKYGEDNSNFVLPNSYFVLKDLCTKKEFVYETSTFLDGNIKLSTLEEGNYYVFYRQDNQDKIVSYRSFYNDQESVMYSLPYKKSGPNYYHKKITITGVYSKNFPLLLVKVEEKKILKALEDVSLSYTKGDLSETIAKKFANKLKEIGIGVSFYEEDEVYSVTQEVSNLNKIYNSGSRFAFKFEESDLVLVPTYTHSSLIKGYLETGNSNDDSDFIKQLAGKAMEAATCKDDSDSSISCSLDKKIKDGYGINTLLVSIPNNFDEGMLENIVNELYNKFITYLS